MWQFSNNRQLYLRNMAPGILRRILPRNAKNSTFTNAIDSLGIENYKKNHMNEIEKIKVLFGRVPAKNKAALKMFVTKFDLEYINETKPDYWQELTHYHPKIETLYNENIANELIKIDDLIPGEKDYSKMNLEDILNLKKEDLKAFEKEATKELKELLEENKQETVVYTRKIF